MITQSELKKLLHYNPETGVFTWLKRKQGARKSCIAGANHNCGYISIGINGKRYLSHRLAWLYMTGEWPKDQIDHINHIRNDNRIANLREATNQQNLKNTRISSRNTSGVNGVHWYKGRNKWQVYVKVNQKVKHLGYFTDKFEAICARMSANNKYGFHSNHGR